MSVTVWNDDCEQAHVLCTTSRARKVVVGLSVVALIATAVERACWPLFETLVAFYINLVTFRVVVPVTVLIINAIVVREVRRRASSDAASNLGVRRHQSTSSNSAVPTVMLVTTSLLYFLLNGVYCFTDVLWMLRIHGWFKFHAIADYLMYNFIYAYNFYVYLITGKQFRSELHKLIYACCRRRSASSSSPAAAAAANVRVARRGQADTAV